MTAGQASLGSVFRTHRWLVDIGLAGVALAAVVALARGRLDEPGWVCAVCSSVALTLRSRFPVPVAVVTLLICLVYYPLSTVEGPIWPAFLIALYTAAAQAHLVIAAVLITVGLLAFAYDSKGGSNPVLNGSAPLLLAGWLVAATAVGAAVRRRRAFLADAAEQACDAERRRAEELRLHAAQERLRMARELHDVLGHHISLISVQASATLHQRTPTAELTEATLRTIRDASGEAMRELRTTLGVLRSIGEPAAPLQQVGLSRLTDLVERANNASLVVTLEAVGEARTVPPQVDLAGYRIIQESLTNVARHSTADTAVVRVRFTERAVIVAVEDNGRPTGQPSVGSGSGVDGMIDRARAIGGDCECGPLPGRGYRVTATLPT